MFFHAGAKDTNDSLFYRKGRVLTQDVNMSTAWLRISNTVGKAV
jgi:hypothetical protein